MREMPRLFPFLSRAGRQQGSNLEQAQTVMAAAGVIFAGTNPAGVIDNAPDGRGYTATEHLQRFRLKRSFIKPYLGVIYEEKSNRQ